jgi:4-hydroxy-tetrahydrodipicolinate synthase
MKWAKSIHGELTLKESNLRLPRGVFAASLTPQNEDLSVNHEKLIEHCKWLLANGCNGIGILGTTGEANSFSVRERIDLLDALVEGGIPPDVMLVGTGCCAIPDTVSLTEHAVSHGVGGVLVLPPFYYKNVSDYGVFKVFDQIIQRVGGERLRIYLYHFPKMSGVPFSISLIEELVRTYPEIIVGMKDSSGDWNNMKLVCETIPDFRVYAGSEEFLLDILRIGGAGCISATTNVTCALAGRIFDEWETNKVDDLQEQLTEIRSIIMKYPPIPAVRQIMASLANQANWLYMRPPHVPLGAEEAKALKEALKSLKL